MLTLWCLLTTQVAPPKVSAYQRYWCLIHGSYMWDVFFVFCPMHDINLDMHSTKLWSKRYCNPHMAVGSTMFVVPHVRILSGHTCMMSMLHIFGTMHDINLDMHSTKLCSKRYCDPHMAVGSTMFVAPPVRILSGHTCMMSMLHIVGTLSSIYVCGMYIRSHPSDIYSIKRSIIPVHIGYRSTYCEGSRKHNICCTSCPDFLKPYMHDDCAAYCRNYVLNLCIWHAYLVPSIRHLFDPAIHHPCLQHIPVH